jgi:hypothetical protein
VFSHWICFTGHYLRIFLLGKKILYSTKHIANVDKYVTKTLDEDGLFDEFIHITNISTTRMDEWNTELLANFERWSEILEFM